MRTRILLIVLAAAALLQPASAPKNEGKVGAREGPAWSPNGELYFVGDGRIYKRSSDGQVQVFRERPNGANGLLFDPQGRLIACESENRRITRTEPDGSVTVLTDNFEGKRYNSPNDLTIDSRGRIYFSDPRYGSRESMEIRDTQGNLVEGVYRIDAPGKVARVTTHEVERPNGLLVSPNDEFLYLADNNNNNVGGARKLYRFRLKPDGNIDPASRKLIFDWGDARGPDGFKMDAKGRLYVAAGLNKPHLPYETANKYKGGVYIIEPESGKLLDFIPIPTDEVTNCAFGGPDRKTLYVTAGGTLWSVPIETSGRR